ncbi:hypothetical protein LBMAG27_03990 [Bacteroidota bacterium]|nr:hypothetical protein LBMAG27_03990 [Bacteroidota bacterium]
MEKIPFINYPGCIASTISEIIKLNPQAFVICWNLFSILFTLTLLVIVYINFSKTSNLKSGIKYFLTSRALFIIVSVIGVIILRTPSLILNEQNVDESQWIANAGTWLNGAEIWKEVSGFTSGPLIYIPLSIMYYLGDGLNYSSIRFFGLLFCIIPSVVFVYLIFKKIFNKESAALLTLPIILFFSFSNSKDFIAYESELVPMLLTSLSFYLFILWQVKNSNPKLFLLGIILGFFPYAKLQAVPIALAIAICAIIELIISTNKSPKQKFVSTLLFISSGILPSIILLIYFLQNGTLLIFWNDYIVQNLFYTQTGLSYHISGISKFFIPIIIAKETPEVLLFIGTVGILFLFCTVLIYKNREKMAKTEKIRIAYFFLIFAISYLCVSFPGSYYYHYENLLIIPFIIFAGIFIGHALPFILERFLRRKIMLSILLLIISCPLFMSLYIGNCGINFIQKGGNYDISAVAKEISKYSMPNEKLVIWGWNHKFYVETGLTQGTAGANSFYEATYALKNDNSYLEKYISEIRKNQPVIFLDASQPLFIGFKNQVGLSHENFPILNDFLKTNYTLVAEINQKKIYVLNERLMRMGIL